jgi:hypothetical protein
MTTTTTTAATATTSKRAEASRRNGRKSRGPKTAEGKSRSRFNALNHGMRARTIVLPGEDADAYQGRVDAWMADLQPRDDAEQSLVEQAARASWQLDRADRAQTTHVSAMIEEAADAEDRRRDDEAVELGRRLSSDPDDPAALVQQLEATAAGCLWLLDRWVNLRDILVSGLSWRASETREAIRLLGRQLSDASHDDAVRSIVLAGFALDPPGHQAFAARTEGGRSGLDPRRSERLPAPNEAQGRRGLLEIVDLAMSRLIVIGEDHDDRETAEAAERAARLSFDESDEGERLRQYEQSCGRSLLRAIAALLKLRRANSSPVGTLPASTTSQSGLDPTNEPENAASPHRNPTNEPENADAGSDNSGTVWLRPQPSTMEGIRPILSTTEGVCPLLRTYPSRVGATQWN